LKPPVEANVETEDFSPNLKENRLETKEIAANKDNSISVEIKLPEGFHLNENAPNRYEISTDEAKIIKTPNGAQKFSRLPVSIPFQTTQTGSANLKLKATVYYCREDNTGVCLIKTLVWLIPLKISKEKAAPETITLKETLTEK